ncbi:MAG TPA: retropepsin-like aspartic protease [Bryobacteraceae bacterium]|nr:retropepsin-like aspartic protease [Bryobacteraceae bacterium]
MCTRRETLARTAWLVAAFATSSRGQRPANGNGGQFTVPFDFAADRGSLLVRARINNRAAILIVDTGSSHTILRPSAAGVNPAELRAPRVGAGVIGDAVGREVTLEVGQRVWQRRRVSVMDLSAALSAYQEKIDGLLGIDFFLEFSQAVIDLNKRVFTFIS